MKNLTNLLQHIEQSEIEQKDKISANETNIGQNKTDIQNNVENIADILARVQALETLTSAQQETIELLKDRLQSIIFAETHLGSTVSLQNVETNSGAFDVLVRDYKLECSVSSITMRPSGSTTVTVITDYPTFTVSVGSAFTYSISGNNVTITANGIPANNYGSSSGSGTLVISIPTKTIEIPISVHN